jgi:hypothetical protein
VLRAIPPTMPGTDYVTFQSTLELILKHRTHKAVPRDSNPIVVQRLRIKEDRDR